MLAFFIHLFTVGEQRVGITITGLLVLFLYALLRSGD